MNNDTRSVGNVFVVKPTETRIDILHSTDFRSKFNDYLSQGHRNFILDFSQVNFMDSAGMGALIGIGQQIVKEGGKLVLCGISPVLGKMFSLIRIDKLFNVFETEQQALQSFSFSKVENKTFVCVGTNDTFNRQLAYAAKDKINIELLNTVDKLTPLLDAKSINVLIVQAGLIDVNQKAFWEKVLTLVPTLIVYDQAQAPTIKTLHDQIGFTHFIKGFATEEEAQYFITEWSKLEAPVPRSAKSKVFDSFIQSIADKILSLQTLLDSAKLVPSKETYEAFKAALHKIAGSAGTYGYTKAGEACKKGELALEEAIQKENFSGGLSQVEAWINQMAFDFNISVPAAAEKLSKMSNPFTVGSGFIVSSDRTTKTIIESIQRANHQQITFETDPDKALGRLKELTYTPEIVLVDESFSESPTKGLELIRAIRSHYLVPGIKFGLITSEDNLELSLQATQEGINFLLKRPLSSGVMEDMFTKSLHERKTPFKVLVLDDDVDMCEYIKEALEQIHLDVRVIMDEKRILEQLYDFQPELLLLDINLPTYDGWSLLKILRSDMRYKNLKVVIISSTQILADLNKRQVKDYDDVWTKPLNTLQLQKNVMNLAAQTKPIFYSTSSFSSRNLFTTNFQAVLDLLNDHRDPLHLVIVSSKDFKKSLAKNMGIKEEYRIDCENLINPVIPKNALRGYLDDGHFAFLFPTSNEENLKKSLDEFLVNSKDKVVLDGILPVQFSAVAISFIPADGNAEDIISYALSIYDSYSQDNTCTVYKYQQKAPK